MDYRAVFEKFNNDYNDSLMKINNCLKYDMVFNGISCSIIYTKENCFENQFLIRLDIESTHYIYPVIASSRDHIIKPWIQEEVYKRVRNRLFRNIDYSTTEFFEAIKNHILRFEPAYSKYDENIRGAYRYAENEKPPYFETFVRRRMGKDMRARVYKMFDGNIQRDIFDFCTKYNMTLRFTNDITRQHNIYIEMEKYK